MWWSTQLSSKRRCWKSRWSLDQPGGDGRVHRMIEGLAAMAKRRALNAEIEAAVEEEDRRQGEEARAAGRLH
jgi:hypothetical protein